MNDMTGTLREFRGRGLARLLKLHQLEWAARDGIASVMTENDETNAAMLAVNTRLGYVPSSSSAPTRATLCEPLAVFSRGDPGVPRRRRPRDRERHPRGRPGLDEQRGRDPPPPGTDARARAPRRLGRGGRRRGRRPRRTRSLERAATGTTSRVVERPRPPRPARPRPRRSALRAGGGARARARRAPAARASRPTTPASGAFAERRGFRHTMTRRLSSLDPSTVDPRSPAGAGGREGGRGLRARPVRRLRRPARADPRGRRRGRARRAGRRAAREMPFDEWLRALLRPPRPLARGQLGRRRPDGRPVAITELLVDLEGGARDERVHGHAARLPRPRPRPPGEARVDRVAARAGSHGAPDPERRDERGDARRQPATRLPAVGTWLSRRQGRRVTTVETNLLFRYPDPDAELAGVRLLADLLKRDPPPAFARGSRAPTGSCACAAPPADRIEYELELVARGRAAPSSSATRRWRVGARAVRRQVRARAAGLRAAALDRRRRGAGGHARAARAAAAACSAPRSRRPAVERRPRSIPASRCRCSSSTTAPSTPSTRPAARFLDSLVARARAAAAARRPARAGRARRALLGVGALRRGARARAPAGARGARPAPRGREQRVGMGASLGALAMLHAHRLHPAIVRRRSSSSRAASSASASTGRSAGSPASGGSRASSARCSRRRVAATRSRSR